MINKKNEDGCDTHKTLHNTCINEIRTARSNYHQSLLTEHKDNPNKFWKTTKSIFTSNKAKEDVSSESNKTKES